ncbi:MAG: hypothetical protein HYY49_00135 [Ignavibacteriales bacterium]|nr:hypothetical protein [Ignavibacteriales bacterium]
MKKTNLVRILVAMALVSSAAIAQSGDLAEQLKKVAKENAEGYLNPLLSSFGAAMNSGFYHSADLHSALGFDVGIKAMLVPVKDEDKEFDFRFPDGTTTKSPTVVGSSTSGSSSQPKGFDLKFVPLVIPQASIGLPFGLEVTGRFVPSVSAGDAGKVSFVGFGLRHDIDQYIPLLPLDIAVHFMTQKLTFNDKNDKKIMSASGTAFGAEVSKSLIIFTLYGGFQIESSSWEVESYTFTDPTNPANTQTVSGLSFTGKNKSRVHVGARFLLLFLNIHADYSLAPHPVATAGVGITFR